MNFTKMDLTAILKRRSLYAIPTLVIVLLVFGCSQTNPKEDAVNLARKSHALKGDQSVESFISDFLRDRGDEVKAIGWEVTRKQDGVYIVNYRYEIHSYREGIGERGFFFEVDLDTKMVSNVTPQHVGKMEPLSSPYKDEKKLVEGLLKDNFGSVE